MFKIGDYIAHPMHGAGVIESIVTKKINGAQRDYYVLKLPVGDMVVMVPVVGCEDIGVRAIISRSEAENVFDAFNELEISMTQNWNKRYRENMDKIKSGERKMLHSAKQILISELVVATDMDYDGVERRLCSALKEG